MYLHNHNYNANVAVVNAAVAGLAPGKQVNSSGWSENIEKTRMQKGGMGEKWGPLKFSSRMLLHFEPAVTNRMEPRAFLRL
jgi:hypothetical protein